MKAGVKRVLRAFVFCGSWSQSRLYECGEVDQATGLLGISLLPREGIALVTHPRADRIVDDQLVLAAVG